MVILGHFNPIPTLVGGGGFSEFSDGFLMQKRNWVEILQRLLKSYKTPICKVFY